MAFYVNLGYRFKLAEEVDPDGSCLLALGMPRHQLERRNFSPSKYPHLEARLFDPQLYLATLSAANSPRYCANLATYPWFGVEGLESYDSREITQSDWSSDARSVIGDYWPQAVNDDPSFVRHSVESCIEFQVALGCEAVILPAPLTADPSSTFDSELRWLDTGIQVASEMGLEVPVFATLALSDFCLNFAEPPENHLLGMILDNLSAREVDGVYVVVEQSSEPPDTRQCGSMRTLWSLLHICEVLSANRKLRVGLNFIGAFGGICRAAGADYWCSGWYKSLYRVRLADAMGKGRAYPLLWSSPVGIDLHLQNDVDTLADSHVELLDAVRDITFASAGLYDALDQGQEVADVPAWRYAQSNITASREHFLASAIALDAWVDQQDEASLRQLMRTRLESAAMRAAEIQRALGSTGRTDLGHVGAWRDAWIRFTQSSM